MERKKTLELEREKKLDEVNSLREQYDSALRAKHDLVAGEIETEIKNVKFELAMEEMRDKLIEKEAYVLDFVCFW